MHKTFGRYGLRVVAALMVVLIVFAVLVAWGVGASLADRLEYQSRKSTEAALSLLEDGFVDLMLVERYATAVSRLQAFCASNTNVRSLRVATPIGAPLFEFQRPSRGRSESLTRFLKLGPEEQMQFEIEIDLSTIDVLAAATRRQVLLALLATIVPVGIGLWLAIRKLALQPLEQSLQAKEANYFVTLNSIGDAVLSTDSDGRVSFMNPVAEALTGWSLEEARQHVVSDVFKIIDFDTRERAQSPVEEVLATGEAVEMPSHTSLIARDGREMQIADSGAPIRDLDGQVAGAVLVFRDVSEDFAQEQKLRDSERRYRAVAEDTPVAICRYLPSGEIVYANESCCKYFEKTPVELVGSSFSSLISKSHRDTAMTEIRALTADSPTLEHEHKTVAATGEIRWQRWTSRALFDADGQPVGFQSVGEDVTTKKRTERALQESQSVFSLFMDHLPAAVFIKAARGRLFHVNKYLRTQFGADNAQSAGAARDFPVETVEQLGHDDDMVLAEGWYEIVKNLEDNAGRERTFRIHNFAIPRSDGKEALVGGIAWDITDTVAASEALRRSERRYREIFEIAEEGIWLIDAEANTVEVNDRMARMLGYTVDEMLGRHQFDFMDEQAREQAEALLDRRRSGIAEKYDFRYRTKTGGDLWAIVSSAPMYDARRTYAGALRLVTDITERKRGEDAMRAQEEQLRLILASTGEGIFGLGMDGRCSFANRACVELLAFDSAEDLVGRRMHDLIHHTRHDGTNYPVQECPTYHSCAKRLVTFADDEPLWRADGTSFHAEYQSFPMVRNDAVVGAVVSFADITERKVSEDTIKRERDFAERLIETAPVIVLVLDVQGNIVRFNSFMEMLSGYKLAEVKGKNWFDTFLAERDVPRIAEVFAKATSGIPTSGNLNAILTRDGKERLIAWYNTTLTDSDGAKAALLAVGLDVTEQKAKDAQLVQAQKMEMVGQLTGGIAHDFNNLLTVILGNLNLLSKSIGPDWGHDLFELLDDSLSAANDGAELTKRLLTFSRKAPLRQERIHLPEFLGRFDRFVRRTLGAGIVVEVDVGNEVEHLLCDPAQLESALLNLALNARDAMPEGGRLCLQAAVKEAAVLDPTLRSGDYLALSISDTGEGMDADRLSRVIEPFYTTKKEKQGTGLGLSMVYGFCVQAGGRFQLASEPGAGTRATIVLPLHDSTDAPTAQAPESSPRDMSHKGTVLVVEDAARARRLAARFLNELGYEVLTAENGDVAIEMLLSDASVDLVFSDIVMPGQTKGDDLYRWVKAQRPQVNILLTTGMQSSEIDELTEAGEASVPIALPKPYTIEQLAAAIQEVCAT